MSLGRQPRAILVRYDGGEFAMPLKRVDGEEEEEDGRGRPDGCRESWEARDEKKRERVSAMYTMCVCVCVWMVTRGAGWVKLLHIHNRRTEESSTS